MKGPEITAQALADAGRQLEIATLEFEKARLETARARNVETDALNRLNQAQKNLDDLVAEIRKTSPAGSDWKRSTGVSC